MNKEENKTENKADAGTTAASVHTISAMAQALGTNASGVLDTALRGAIGATVGTGLGAMLSAMGQEKVGKELCASSAEATKSIAGLPVFGSLGATALSLASIGSSVAGSLLGAAITLVAPGALATKVGAGLNDVLAKPQQA